MLRQSRAEAPHWRVLIARTVAAVAAEVALFYVIPLDHDLTWSSLVWIALCLAGFVVVLVSQVVQIARSPYPRLRAIVAIMVSLPVFLLVFAATYYLASRTSGAAFTENLSRTDALYFTVTVFSTVGFGDIHPTEPPTRVLVMFQMLGDLLLVGLIGRVIVGAVGLGVQRKSVSAVPAGSASSRPDDES
jgi:hypothetical protein